MTELIQELYPIALDSGISSFSFWNMTYGEICDQIESYNRLYQQQLKQRIFEVQLQSVFIKQEILPLLVEKLPDDYHKIQVWDIYPDLFKEEKKSFEQEQEADEFEHFKEKRRRFAEQHNRKRVKYNDS